MLPTPTTTAASIRKVFTAAVRPRAMRWRWPPSNARESGSGPRSFSSGCSCGSFRVKRMQPKRRGSRSRSSLPSSSTTSTWSCFPGETPTSSTRRLPDMPRWTIAVPCAVRNSRYLARRSTSSMVAPSSARARPGGTGQRSRESRTTTCSTRRPFTWGRTPRRVVSTSGSSGIGKNLRPAPRAPQRIGSREGAAGVDRPSWRQGRPHVRAGRDVQAEEHRPRARDVQAVSPELLARTPEHRVAPEDLEFVSRLVRERSANVLDRNKEYLIEARLLPIARGEGLSSVAALVERVRQDRHGRLAARVVEALTRHDTSFFRDVTPFEALRKVVLPELVKRRGSEQSLRFWSAACASGQEAYSLLMTLCDHFPQLRAWDVKALGTDLSDEK